MAPSSTAPEVYTPGLQQTPSVRSPVVKAEEYSGYTSPPNYNSTPVYPNAYGSYQQLQPGGEGGHCQDPTPDERTREERKERNEKEYLWMLFGGSCAVGDYCCPQCRRDWVGGRDWNCLKQLQ